MLGLVISNPRKKPVPPQKGCVLADAAMGCSLAHAQALVERFGIVLPTMALPQSRHWRARQSITGFTAGLAAIPWQVTAEAPWPQLSGVAMHAAAGRFDYVLWRPANPRKTGFQLIALLWVKGGELCYPA
jgi:hypothetical protein